jgi:3-deoxy-7-phosphoheptulonate synthase
VEFFTSHEGLNLLYESAGTRTVPRRAGHYNLTTHFPWIGDRTREIDEAHVEYFSGIRNPIGVKTGPAFDVASLSPLVDRLNPENEAGRLTLIHRFGAERIENDLPRLLEAVKRDGRHIACFCDPMHGNTTTTTDGRKTRDFDAILSEINRAFDIHDEASRTLAGVHFELTGEHVTECVGGARGLSEADLGGNYRSPCDPRLNYEQALELAFLVARRLGNQTQEGR